MNAPVQNTPIYQALAEAFAAEGVDHQFTLMGDGNMHWATAMKNLPGMTTTHARHEHCAAMMAVGYSLATGKVGVTSVTCGPGFTQLMTALTTASRANIPLVVFAGEAPMHAKWYNQWLDQPPFAAASGAHYIAAHSPQRMYQYVREAFYIAQHERKPVVIGVPYDLQKQPLPNLGAYQPSSDILPKPEPSPPNPKQADQLAEKLANAKCPIVIAGVGAVRSGAAKEIEAMADAAGALLATTLRGRGMFDHHPFSVGVSGGYSRAITHELSPQVDLVVMLGASANYYTVDGGNLYPNAEFVQVDVAPQGLNGGIQVADLHIRADAKLTAEAVTARLKTLGKAKSTIRTPELAKRIKEEPADTNTFTVEPGLLDPRAVIAELDRVIPKDYDSISGSGHQSYFHTVMRGRPPEKYFAIREFGAIGNSISLAMGVAMARKDGKTVLFEGDGSLLMHIQEMEVMRRHGIKLLMCIMNDGAYGAEIHKLRHDGVDDSGAIFGRTDLTAIAKGFGLRGHTITDVSQIEPLFKAYAAQDTAEVWNFQVSDKVVNPTMRRGVRRGHGKM